VATEKNRKFSDVIRKMRINRGLSQKDFSEFLGVSQSNIATWESGQGEPAPKNLRKISEKLGIPIESLMEDSSPRVITAEFRKIPVVSWTTAGLAHSYEDLAAQIDDLVDGTTRDPNAFAIEVVGDSMEREVHAGDRVVLEPNREASSGEMAYVRFTDENGGGGTLKWFYRSGPEGRVIKLVAENPDWPTTEHPIQTVQFAYPVHNIIRRRPKRRP
jgi:SOS-response transcriptional repressor LexA